MPLTVAKIQALKRQLDDDASKGSIVNVLQEVGKRMPSEFGKVAAKIVDIEEGYFLLNSNSQRRVFLDTKIAEVKTYLDQLSYQISSLASNSPPPSPPPYLSSEAAFSNQGPPQPPASFTAPLLQRTGGKRRKRRATTRRRRARRATKRRSTN